MRANRTIARLVAPAIAALALASTPAHAVGPIAESGADFSTTQGGGWYYGYWNRSADADQVYAASEFEQFATCSFHFGGSWVGAPAGAPAAGVWSAIRADGSHPTGPNNGDDAWVIRRYVVPTAGTFTVDGLFGNLNHGGGSGTTGHLLVNGTLFHSMVAGFDQVPAAYQVFLGPLSAGTTLDFAVTSVGKDGADHDYHDWTEFSATISSPLVTATPEPGTWALLATGLAGVGAAARRRRRATA